MEEIVNKYGSAAAALAALGEMQVRGAGLSPDEAAEMAALSSHEPALRLMAGAPAPEPQVRALQGYPTTNRPRADAPDAPAGRLRLVEPQPERLEPIVWYRRKGTKWVNVCLAASLAGWDPRCEDGETVTEAEYDAGIEAALALLKRCVAECADPKTAPADSTAVRRIFVLAHPQSMCAVVAYKPTPVETAQVLAAALDGDYTPEQRAANTGYALWSRCLWPKMGTKEMQRLMDEDPGAYGVVYPVEYLSAIGVRMEDVRKKR